jgi:hypothetical protein
MATSRSSKSTTAQGGSASNERTSRSGMESSQSLGGAATTAAGGGSTQAGASAAGVGQQQHRMGDGQDAGARGLVDGLQQRVKEGADQQKNRAADGLGGIAQVFQHAGNEMRSENETLASYVDMAGDRLRRFADQVRERGVEDMLEDVQRFARQRPAMFIGGAFLLGLGVARFMKSSSEHDGRRYGYADGGNEYGSEFGTERAGRGMGTASSSMPASPAPPYGSDVGDVGRY